MFYDTNTTIYIVCGLCLLSRLGHIVTTRLATKRLNAETNLLAKNLGWRFIVLTSGIARLPLYNLKIGVALTAISFLVSISNGAFLASLKRSAVQSSTVWMSITRSQ